MGSVYVALVSMYSTCISHKVVVFNWQPFRFGTDGYPRNKYVYIAQVALVTGTSPFTNILALQLML